jgi:hypothetical protein
LGWEAARPCASKEAKPAKIDSLKEKGFCARPLKDLSIFAGFVSASGGASRGVGCRATGAALVSHSVQSRFGFGCIIPPEFDFPKIDRFFCGRLAEPPIDFI